MSVTERLGAVGAWSVNLRPNTPQHIRRAVGLRTFGFGHIVITGTAHDIRFNTDAQILALARYVGIYRTRPDDLSIGGPGVDAWLGDEDGKGPVVSGTLGGNWTFSQWRSNLCPAWLTVDSSITAPIGNYNRTFTRVSYREAIEEICDRFGAEYRVTPEFDLQMGEPDDIFDPLAKTMIVRRRSGRDYPYRTLVGSVHYEQDLEDWTRQVRYYTGTEAVPVLNTATLGGTVNYRAPDGSAIVMDRIVEDFSGSGDGASLAAAQLGRFDHVHEEITLSGLDYDIGDAVNVGEYVHVFDPERGIYNINTPRAFRGGWVYPLTLRVIGHTWPLRLGMGVYFRRFQPGESVPDYIDLTPWVEWETDQAKVEVGDPPRLATT